MSAAVGNKNKIKVQIIILKFFLEFFREGWFYFCGQEPSLSREIGFFSTRKKHQLDPHIIQNTKWYSEIIKKWSESGSCWLRLILLDDHNLDRKFKDLDPHKIDSDSDSYVYWLCVVYVYCICNFKYVLKWDGVAVYTVQ